MKREEEGQDTQSAREETETMTEETERHKDGER
jgi:hypothetical protein